MHQKDLQSVSFVTGLWIMLLVLLWAGNSVLVKVTTQSFPPFYAAFIRFTLSMPFVLFFIKSRIGTFKLNKRDFILILLLGIMTFVQIALFYIGSKYTTGGRITLFVFSYPLVIPLLSPFFLNSEHFEKRSIIGSAIAFIGLFYTLRSSFLNQNSSTFKGDVIEILSCCVLTVQLLYNKRLMKSINKWKIFFYRNLTAIICFFITALLFENLEISKIKIESVLSMFYQALAVSVFCFLSFQYILSKHKSSTVTIFFFATPIFGLILGVFILNEKFDFSLLIGSLFVAAGIYIVNKPKEIKV